MIKIEYTKDKYIRQTTFCKRLKTIEKKLDELVSESKPEFILIIVSDTGTIYTHTSEKFHKSIKEAILNIKDTPQPLNLGDKKH